MPLFTTLPGDKFGPEFLPTAADYADPALRAAIQAHGWLFMPPIAYGPRNIAWQAGPAPAPPSARHWLGTDPLSRDSAARLLYGLRNSLFFGLALGLGSAALAVLLGTLQGYCGGLTDLLLQRFTEIWSGLPLLFILLSLGSLFSPSLALLFCVMLAFSWMHLANLVRAEALRARTADYVRAAQLLGLPAPLIILRHILPHAAIAALTTLPFVVAEAISLLAGLDFLGFGLPAGTPTLGGLLAEARANPSAPWLGLGTCLMLGLLLFALVRLGERGRATLTPPQG